MSIVVSRNDARWHFNGLELLLACTNDRKVGALEKVLAPVRHDGYETLRSDFHQRVAILRSGFDTFFPVLHLTDFRHAALLRGCDVLAIVFFRQPFTGKAPPVTRQSSKPFTASGW